MKTKGSLNIYYHEARKLLLNNNTILFMILIIFINGWWILNEKPYLTVEEVHYRNYMLKLQGEYTHEKYDYVQKEYTNVLSQNNLMSDQSMRISALEKVKENAEYLKNQYEQGNTYNFIYEKGYTRLTSGNNNNRDAVLSLILAITLSILLSGLISTERQSKMIKILNTSLKGKNELLRVKYIISLIISIIVFILIYLPKYYYI